MSKAYKIQWIFGVLILCRFQSSSSSDIDKNWDEEKNKHEPSELNEKTYRFLATAGKSANFEKIVDPILVPRTAGTENNVQVQKYISDYMSNLGWNVETDHFEDESPLGTKPFTNIITTLDPEVPRRLVLACHFDSVYKGGADIIAATDSAVPCAQLLHLAAVMKSMLNAQKASEPNVTLQYIFFDGEEAFVSWSANDSLYGSRHLAEKWHKTPYPPDNEDDTTMLHRMDMMVLLDLLGAKEPELHDHFEETHSWYSIMQKTEQKLKKSKYWDGPSNVVIFKGKPPFDYSIQDDHLPFLERDVHIVHLIAVPFPTVWHEETDNKEALDFPTIENLNRIFRIFVARYLHLKVA